MFCLCVFVIVRMKLCIMAEKRLAYLFCMNWRCVSYLAGIVYSNMAPPILDCQKEGLPKKHPKRDIIGRIWHVWNHGDLAQLDWAISINPSSSSRTSSLFKGRVIPLVFGTVRMFNHPKFGAKIQCMNNDPLYRNRLHSLRSVTVVMLLSFKFWEDKKCTFCRPKWFFPITPVLQSQRPIMYIFQSRWGFLQS